MDTFIGCALIALGFLITFLSGACAAMLVSTQDKTLAVTALLAVPFALVGIGLMVLGGGVARRD